MVNFYPKLVEMNINILKIDSIVLLLWFNHQLIKRV